MADQNYIGMFDKTAKTVSSVQGYIRIQDLEIKDCGGAAIYVEGPDPRQTTHAIEAVGSAEGIQFDVINCVIHDNNYVAIGILWYRDGYIQNNDVYGPSDYGDSTNNESLVSLGGGTDTKECDDGDGEWDCMGASTGYTISNNKIHRGRELLVVGKHATEFIVEHNSFYDMRSGGVAIYMMGSYNNTIRYNLIYDDSNRGRSPGIWSADEHEVSTSQTNRGEHKIHNNLIAGTIAGIKINCNACSEPGNSWSNLTNIKLYNNTLVDNDTNILFATTWSDQGTTSGHQIKNNISETNEAGTTHTNDNTLTGVTWSHNNYDEDPGGDANDGAVVGDAALVRASSFYSMTLGSVDGTEFKIQASGVADNAGTSIAGYNNRISLSDFTIPSVTLGDDSNDPDIGAWMILLQPHDITGQKEFTVQKQPKRQ
jgi:hypothetical protein